MTTSADRMRRMRERRAKAIEADPDAPRLRDADDLLAPAIEETIAALKLDDKDAAAAQLARRFAAIIDDARDPAWAVRWLGPELLRNLEALQATPMSRAKLKKDPGPHVPNRLDELRSRRRQYPGA